MVKHVAKPVYKPIMIEDAEIVFRNFSGKKTQYNAEGDRNFCVFLEPELAAELAADGWNIKVAKPRDEDDEPRSYVQVKVKYDFKPPRIVLITGKGKTTLSEDMVSLLDWAEIVSVDLMINPSFWDVNGKTGVKAYLKSMYVTLVEDKLADKYYDVPDSAASAIVENYGEEPF